MTKQELLEKAAALGINTDCPEFPGNTGIRGCVRWLRVARRVAIPSPAGIGYASHGHTAWLSESEHQ